MGHMKLIVRPISSETIVTGSSIHRYFSDISNLKTILGVNKGIQKYLQAHHIVHLKHEGGIE
jgi:hypothetical protein